MWGRKRKEMLRQLEHDILAHIEGETRDNLDRGMSLEEARSAALRKFGNVQQIKEQTREVWTMTAWEQLFQDLRYGFRTLRRNPGFAAIAIFTLALGIGAATAIFSVVDAVLLRALPYPNPQGIVRVWEQNSNGHGTDLADGNVLDFQTHNNTLTTLAVYGYGMSTVSGGREPVRANIALVSNNFFEVLGVKPFRGRLFAADEQRPHSARAALVSYGYWQRYLGGSTDLSALHLKTWGGVYSVVGVMPAGFAFPPGVAVWLQSEQVFPKGSSRSAHNWKGLGRLRAGVTVAQARANLSAIAHRIKEQYGKEADLSGAVVVSLADATVGDVRTALLTLLGAVGFLLLIACANVAGLLLARTAARRQELAVRAALGAGRRRFLQQFLLESFALSFGAGVGGVLMAAVAVKLLPLILPATLPRQEGIAMNTTVLLFAFATAVGVAVSLGLFAAGRAAGEDLQKRLTSGSRSYSGGVSSQRLRGFLVVGEIAMTLVILVGSGLLGRSFLRLISISPGLRPQHLVTVEFSLPNPEGHDFLGLDGATVARQVHLLENLLTRLRALPGVEAVGLTGAMPVAAGDNLADGTFLLLNGQKSPTNFEEWERISHNPSQTGHALYAVAGQEYFRTMGIPLMRGRLFDDRDSLQAPHVAVISQTLARERWPQQDPIGQLIHFGNMDGNLKPLTIVGVVGDVRAEGLNRSPSSIIYVNYRQRGMNANATPTILLRSAAPVGDIMSAARRTFHDLAPEIPVKFSTFADEMGGWLADRRFLLLLVGFFAVTALALAAVGIYGVVAFAVTRRTQEIGIRMALGAQRSDVLRLVVGEGAWLAVLGVGIGVVASLALTRLLSSLLFGVSATDPLTFIGVAALLSLVALLASYLPARRAMRLDPNHALRYE